MPVQTLSCVPPKFEAGNTVVWTTNFNRFPATEWTLSFVIVQNGELKFASAGVPDGNNFTVTLTSAQTADLAGGTYDWSEYVTQAGERTTARTGTVIVLPNLAVTQEPTQAQQMVALLTEALQRLYGGTNLSVNINGQSFTKRDVKQYRDDLTYWQGVVANEQRTQAALRGNLADGRVRVAFVSPYNGCAPFYQGFPNPNGCGGGC